MACSSPRPPSTNDTIAVVNSCVALHDVDATVGEAAFVAQPDDVELEILGGVAARDEVR